jgi:subtilisin family serine protease
MSKGTSDATAIVSGAAALVRARFPELSAPEVIRRLTSTADDAGPPGRDVEYGYGILNIVRALTEELPPPENTAAPSPPSLAEDKRTTVPSGLAAAGILLLFALIAGAVWTINHRRSSRDISVASND